MIIPIRCVTCGKVLADKWEFYKKKMQNHKTEQTNKYFFDTYAKDVLDELGLEKYCCRRHMIAHVDIIDQL